MIEINSSTSDGGLQAVSPTESDSLQDYSRRSLENVRQRLPQAARELVAAAVARVLVRYDGCGDSGEIDEVEYLAADGARLDLAGMVSISEETLMDLFYDLMQVRHPGWENGDGAYGDFFWNLTDDTLHHTHNDRFTDYETTEHEGL